MKFKTFINKSILTLSMPTKKLKKNNNNNNIGRNKR